MTNFGKNGKPIALLFSLICFIFCIILLVLNLEKGLCLADIVGVHVEEGPLLVYFVWFVKLKNMHDWMEFLSSRRIFY